MSLSSRLKKLESTMDAGSGEVRIKVTHHSEADFERRKNIFDAKKTLGMLTPKQIRNTIFVSRSTADMETEGQLPMTREEARAILKREYESTTL